MFCSDLWAGDEPFPLYKSWRCVPIFITTKHEQPTHSPLLRALSVYDLPARVANSPVRPYTLPPYAMMREQEDVWATLRAKRTSY